MKVLPREDLCGAELNLDSMLLNEIRTDLFSVLLSFY